MIRSAPAQVLCKLRILDASTIPFTFSVRNKTGGILEVFIKAHTRILGATSLPIRLQKLQSGGRAHLLPVTTIILPGMSPTKNDCF